MRDLGVTTVVGTEGPADDSFDLVLREMMRVDSPEVGPTLPTGLILDDAYRIEAEIGRGGMGRVYRAHDIRLERDVAIKIHIVFSIDGKRWSLREASALARLAHPNVVTVYEVGTYQDNPWVAMEYVANGTARRWSEAAERTIEETLAIYLAAGRGLAAAHAAGIVHRDFKPDNILIAADGRPRVADFGLALQLAKADGHATSIVLGTPAYMAPEQWNRLSVGMPADQFAFATSLWEALTGQRPFRGKTEAEIRASWLSPPRSPARPLPKHIETALRRALAIDPGQRWPEIDDLLSALERDPRRTRRRIGIALAAGVVLAGGGAAAAMSLGSDAAPTEPPCEHVTDNFATVTKLRGELPALADQRAVAVLDAWLAAWRTNRVRACEDTFVRRTQPIEVHELRALCFDRARAAAELTLPELAAAKDPRSFIDGLPRLADCDDVARMRAIAPLPADPAARAEIEAVSNDVPRLYLLMEKNTGEAALEPANQLLARAKATGRKALIAEIMLMVGIVRSSAQKDGVRELYEESAKLAAEAGDDFLVAKDWMYVIDYLNARLEQPAEADKLIAVAEAAVLRAGNPDKLRADLQATLAQLDANQGRLTSARTRLVEATTLHAQAEGEDSELARLYNLAGGVAMKLADYDGARAALQNAARILESNFGPTYRHLAVVWTTLGQVEYYAGRLPESRAQLERARALKEQANGKDSPSLVPTLTALAQTLGELHEYDLATSHIARAIQLGRDKLGPGHQKTLDAMVVEASLLLAQKRYDEAEERLRTAQPLQAKLGDVPSMAALELARAELYLKTHRLAEARAANEHARTIVGTDGANADLRTKVDAMAAAITAAEQSR